MGRKICNTHTQRRDIELNFRPLALQGSFLIEPERIADERGFFARTYCRQEFAEHDLNPEMLQCSISVNTARHTLRGMHFQKTPHQEAKLVRCTQGAAHHVIIDLRGESESYLQWAAVELNARDRSMLYIPEGVAHGFITLEDDSEVFYQMSENYHPESAAGVRWNDPAFGIEWPIEPAVISEQDSNYPDFGSKR